MLPLVASSSRVAAFPRLLTRQPSLLHTFATSSLSAALHFDTHAFVTRLEASGMPRHQADTLVGALGDVVEESIKGFERGLVSREEGERWRYSQKVRLRAGKVSVC